jgi:hypothetical protein
MHEHVWVADDEQPGEAFSGNMKSWYQQALEVVVETCEWVLGQPDPSKYLLHWSG